MILGHSPAPAPTPRIIESWGRSRFKVTLPGKMIQPHQNCSEDGTTIAAAENSIPKPHHLSCIYCCSQHQATAVSGAGPGPPVSDIYAATRADQRDSFPWQSLVPHVAHSLISRTKSYVDMQNDRARSQCCILVAEEVRRLSCDGIEEAGLISWEFPPIIERVHKNMTIAACQQLRTIYRWSSIKLKILLRTKGLDYLIRPLERVRHRKVAFVMAAWQRGLLGLGSSQASNSHRK